MTETFKDLPALPGTPQEQAWLKERLETLSVREEHVLAAALMGAPPECARDAAVHLQSLDSYEICFPAGSYEQLGELYLRKEASVPEEVMSYVNLDQLSEQYEDTHELKVLKLRLDGLTAQEVGEILNISSTVVSTRFRNTCEKLTRGFILDYIEIDVPGIRKLCGMPILIASGYTKVSELLRDMPSDQELLKLSIQRGHIVGLSGRRALRNEDLSLLKKKMDGQTNAAIAKEYCVSPNYIRQRLVWIHKTIIHDLGIQIDLEKL